jgi:predicted nucleic acid-binding protein
MFKYVKFDRVETPLTVLEFRGGDEIVKVNYFTGVDVVSIEAENEDNINALIDSQPNEINCTEITQDEFKNYIKVTTQYKRIKNVVAKYYDNMMDKIFNNYPLAERETWNTQLAQAKAYKASGDEDDAPFLKTLADAESGTVADFADAVIAKAQEYENFSAQALSKKRAYEKELMSKIGL